MRMLTETVSKQETIVAGRRVFFTRRRYDNTTYTWAHVFIRGRFRELGDPWPSITVPRKELEASIQYEAGALYLVQLADRQERHRADSEAALRTFWADQQAIHGEVSYPPITSITELEPVAPSPEQDKENL